MLEDDLPTSTSKQQNALERKLLPLYQEVDAMEAEDVDEVLRLQRSAHVTYLQSGLGKLPSGFASLDASRPWITYWIVHSLALLGADLPSEGPSASDIIAFLQSCQTATGGFGGGPQQIAHLAPTYAATAALLTLGGEEALRAIDRTAMADFLYRMAVPASQGGGFRVHEGGETDLRGCYLAIATAHMLGLDKHALAARAGMTEYIRRCQTYEGGLGGEPGNEAHGGYTFCGLAALALIRQESVLDLPALLHWATQRQGMVEGGFNGRTNKLVDGCYSFWQGALFAVMQRLPSHTLRISSQGTGSHNDATTSGQATSAAGVNIPAVPPLPLMVPKNPVEQAGLVLGAKQATAQQLINAALHAGDRADAALQTGTERSSTLIKQEARSLLDQAGAAQTAAEAAHMSMNCINCSAALLYPVPDAADPPFPATALTTGATTIHLGPPLYNYKALQLWILRCCQQARGGLKDKPGKSADYYHTCYCLSGLAAAQYASNCVLGPRENLLRKADVLINVLEDKLEAALKFYTKLDAGATPAGKEAGTGGEQPGSQRAASKPSAAAAAAAADVEMANV